MTIIRVLAAAWMFFATLAQAAEVDPPAVIGRLNHVAGAVSFAPAQAPEDWVAASVNRPITTGDRLWVDAGGRAEMHVGSLAVRMDSQTSVDVLNLDDRSLQLRLAQGSTHVRLRRAARGEPVEIATPNGAVVLERPGSYRVDVDPRGALTSVTVRGGGQAEVFEANGSFLVEDDRQATISGPQQDLTGAPAPDEFDRWAATRDRREDNVASTRYVPAEMTGYEDLDAYGSWRTVPQYGTVWQPTTVPAGWAPYRQGHWVWVAPWGWTWVDDAPWGFAPSHYGRWVWLGERWAWTPGRMVARPVYAPALVAFLGGANFSVSIGAGSAPAVGWVPLGWREPYRPWYRASRAHLRDVNVTNVTNVTNINTVTNIRYVNRSALSGVTVVSRENFAAARPVQGAALRVPARTIAAAPVTTGSPVATPARASLAQARVGARPPAEVRTREAVAVSAPPAPARAALSEGRDNRAAARLAGAEERPRVRVIDRRERVNPAQAQPQRAAERQAQPAPQPESTSVRERAAEKAPQPQAARPGERRAPAPPAEVTARPTFDRSSRTQAAPQADNRTAPPAALDPQRVRQQAEQRAMEQQGQDQARRERQSQRQQPESGKDGELRRSQQQDRQTVGEQKASREPRQEQAERQQQAREQAQQRGQQQAQQRTQEQARQQQQAEQQTQQRAQEQAQRQQQARERTQEQAQQRAAQQQAQQQAREQARQQQAQQQQAQRAQQQAQQQHAHEQARQQQAQQQQAQRAQQQAQQQQAQQQAREQARQQQAQQQQAQRAQQQAQQEQARQQRRDQSQEKGGRERSHADKAEKEKG